MTGQTAARQAVRAADLQLGDVIVAGPQGRLREPVEVIATRPAGGEAVHVELVGRSRAATVRADDAMTIERAPDRPVRAERFARLLASLDAQDGGVTVLGADRHGRYAVLTESERSGRWLVRAATAIAAERVASSEIGEGCRPVALFDLDVLAGKRPPAEGDRVEHDGDVWSVIYANEEWDGNCGEVYTVLSLAEGPDETDARILLTGIDEHSVTVIERGAADERLPVRYEVAICRTIVAFNSTPEAV